jgi:NAD(P)-dependent dehydrogenase (short-subunit alcohol dehydrogenase family)
MSFERKTVLITGTSTGIGMEAALFFAEKGWNVAATMRNPEKRTTELHGKPGITLFHLDVMDAASIHAALEAVVKTFGRIDAVVNNAGYGLFGVFEATSEDQVRRQFDTNVFGLMDVCRVVLPVFRNQGGGTFVNVASMGGRITFPLYSVYHATKWAVEGFSESLQYEVRPFNIKVKIVEPGPIKTPFYEHSRDTAKKDGLTAYDRFTARVQPNADRFGEYGASPRRVAKAIFRAANGGWWKMRYPVWTLGTLVTRRFTPDAVFQFIIRFMLRA